MRTPGDAPRKSASPAAAKRLERGFASWVTVLLVVGLAAGAYLAVVFVPPTVLHYEVKQVVRDYGNQAIKNRNDTELVEKMLQKIRSLQQQDVVDESGRVVKVPVIDLRREDVTWERIESPPTLHVAFEYPRTLEFPWLDRSIERVYTVDLSMDQVRADWGPVR